MLNVFDEEFAKQIPGTSRGLQIATHGNLGQFEVGIVRRLGNGLVQQDGRHDLSLSTIVVFQQ